ncbi:DUF1684 domain-containing protein [Roseivirga echinicomitans]
MKKSTIFGILIVLLLGVTVFNFLTVGESPKTYLERIETERKEKDRRMLASSSPLLEDEKKIFTNLNYYPVDPTYKILARLVDIKRKTPVYIPTTTGEEEKYILHSYAEFEIDGKPQRLLLYKDWDDLNPRRLFLMFADDTSGDDTYGGGRYMDLIESNTNSIVLDFNTAYNPYCHFNPEYSCPIPPAENLMNVPIKAGEKLYKNF